MSILSRKTPFILLIGDILAFAVSLWLTLFIRYGGLPSDTILSYHIAPFSFLFIIWVIIFFISGLYEKRAVILRDSLPQTLISAQIVNIVTAVVFFYFVPLIDIAPKTNLFLYLIVSSGLILFWRISLYNKIVPERKEEATIVGSGGEMDELLKEVNGNPHYNFRFKTIIDLSQGSISTKPEPSSIMVIDLYNQKVQAVLPELYNLLLSKIRFIDMHQIYENVFGRVALSLLDHSWFIENVSAYPKYVYDGIKRVMDFSIALVFGIISLVIYPFVYIAIKLDDGGSVFVIQERVGKDGKIIRIPKFRSMKASDKGVWVTENDGRITRVGKFLRRSRIDELPQLFSVMKGDMSLVGPRPDIHDLGLKLSKEIPYYNVRSMIKPGLSGWAQIRQDLPPQSLEETKIRLAYDFYYIKNRSILLDLKIALQTIATLASRAGK